MILTIIAVVLIAFSYEPPIDSAATGPAASWSACFALILATWLMIETCARWAARRLAGPFDRRAASMERYQRARWLHAGLVIGGYTVLIHLFDWPQTIRQWLGLDGWILIDDLVVLLPGVASLLLGAASHFRVEEGLRAQGAGGLVAPRWKSRWSHVGFHARHHLGVVLVPLLVLVSIQDAVVLIFEGSSKRPAAELISALAGLAIILIFAPLLLRLLWRAQPLPAGPLRTRLEQLSRRLGFRSSDILIWNTDGAVINAAVAGILPWPRYVLLSDALLAHMSSDEVEAVFGHEVGHVRHHHLWFFMAFLIGAMSFLAMALSALTPLAEMVMGEVAATQLFTMAEGLVLPSTCLALYFGVFFGFLSRRFERQADIFGCRAVSLDRSDPAEPGTPPGNDRYPPLRQEGIQIFIEALEKIAALNGAVREARSWRHFSIAKRVDFLKSLAERPHLDRSFQRVVFLLKMLVIAALIAGVWFVWSQSPDSSSLL